MMPFRSRYLQMRQRRRVARQIVILGSGDMAVKLLEEIDYMQRGPMVAGIVAHEAPPAPWTDAVPLLGPPSQLAEIVKIVHPARIVIALADRRDRLPLQGLLDARVRGIFVEDALEFYEQLTGKIAIESLKPSALILSPVAFRNHPKTEMIARIASLITVAIVLTLATPVLLAIALAIKIESRGPVLFVQYREGKNARRFGLLKFRTMRASVGEHSEWVQDNVARITRLGGLLRRFRLDELPQLLNVLKGDMNMVGPRPHPTSNRQSFTDQIAYYQIRSTVRPGLTGWAQVRYGYANNLEEETEKMRYDLYYIKNRSFWLDARILVKTILVVLRGDGGAGARRPLPAPAPAWPAVRERAEDTAYSSWLRPVGRS